MSTTAEDRSPGQVLCTSSGTPQASSVLADRLQQPVTSPASGRLGQRGRLAGQPVHEVKRGGLILAAAHFGRLLQPEVPGEHWKLPEGALLGTNKASPPPSEQDGEEGTGRPAGMSGTSVRRAVPASG